MLHKRLAIAAAVICACGASSAAFAADGVWVKASRIADSDIDESSSLAVSRQFMGVAYTANDEPDPVVYAIDIPSGEVVGTTRLTGVRLRDPEALALDKKGRLWLADTGDNKNRRQDAALYRFPEQGPATVTVPGVRFPIEYSDGQSHNVETILLNPVTGEKYLLTKTQSGTGKVFELPRPLQADVPNVAMELGHNLPPKVSDGAFSPNGAWIVFRDEKKFYVVSLRTRSLVQTVTGPPLDKGESISFNPSGRSFLVGSEGEKSPLYWVGFDQAAGRIPTR
jgi:hypothetical protein